MNKIKTRDMTIDTLRALSIVVMMIMHVNAYFLKDKFSLIFWSYSQWVVPAFIFCSFAVGKYEIASLKGYFSFLIKRLKRIVIPYYIFLIFHFVLIWLLTQKFVTFNYVLENIVFTGGTSFNWLVLLFIYLTIFGPVMYFGVFKKFILGIMLLIPGAVASAIFMTNQNYWSKSFRLGMLLPWITLTIMLLFFRKLLQEKSYRLIGILTIVSLFTFLFFYFFIVAPSGMRQDLYYHKYPPNIYFLIYCIATTPIAYFLSKIISDFLLIKNEIARQIVQYISKKSYAIFFVHTLILYIIEKTILPTINLTYQQFLIMLFVLTFVLMRIVDFLQTSIVQPKMIGNAKPFS